MTRDLPDRKWDGRRRRSAGTVSGATGDSQRFSNTQGIRIHVRITQQQRIESNAKSLRDLTERVSSLDGVLGRRG